MHTNTEFYFLVDNIKHLLCSVLKVVSTELILFRMVEYPPSTKIYMCVGLRRLLCFIVNLSFAVLMTCGAHGRHCCGQSFWFSSVAIYYFRVLVGYEDTITYL